MENQVKIKSFKYAITRPASLAFQQMLQEAEYEGVRKITDGKFFFKPIYYYKNGTYEEYCNVIDLEEYPVAMINYLRETNFSQILEGLDNATKKAEELLQLIENMEKGIEEFDLSRLRELFLQYKPYSIIIDDVSGTTTICDIENNVDSSILEKLLIYQEKFDKATTRLNLFISSTLRRKYKRRFGRITNHR